MENTAYCMTLNESITEPQKWLTSKSVSFFEELLTVLLRLKSASSGSIYKWGHSNNGEGTNIMRSKVSLFVISIWGNWCMLVGGGVVRKIPNLRDIIYRCSNLVGLGFAWFTVGIWKPVFEWPIKGQLWNGIQHLNTIP